MNGLKGDKKENRVRGKGSVIKEAASVAMRDRELKRRRKKNKFSKGKLGRNFERLRERNEGE